MIIKQILKFSLFILLVSIPFISNASHVQGGEITYKWLGGKKYEVTAKVYRDCSEIPMDYRTFQVQAQGINPINISHTRVSIEDITARCKDSSRKLCNPQNTTIGVSYATELHTFIGFVDFDDTAFNVFIKNGVCEIYFNFFVVNRSSNISNINPTNFYIESMLNICLTKFKNSSPKFENKNVLLSVCNRPVFQNFGAKDFDEFDSISYELATPMNGFNSYETYISPFSKTHPISPFCPPNPGTVNCRAFTNLNPPRGFYFNPENADIIYTPNKCDEICAIAIKTNEFRKDSMGNWKLIGFVIRDIQLIVHNGNDRNFFPKFKKNYFTNYKFKTREETCIDFETYDTTNSGGYFISGNLGDVTDLKMTELPSGATFKYLDSSARLKTGRFCWKVNDSIYSKLNTKSKKISLTIELKDNFCDRPIVIQRSFSITILPLDSISNLNVLTYLDRNKNSIKNLNEKGFATSLHIKDKNTSKYITTSDSGFFKNKVKAGKFQIGIAQHPYLKNTNKDTTIELILDSAYNLNFGANLSSGIYGRIYNDNNGNCKYDAGETTYSGYKVFTDSNKHVGISDISGLYYIDAPAGSYNLTCGYNDSKLKVNCPSNNKISLTTTKDSAHLNQDFGISKNQNYTDISTNIKLTRLSRGGYATVDVEVKNEGYKTARYISVITALDSRIKQTNWYGYSFIDSSTFVAYIDSITPNQTKKFKLIISINPKIFVSGDVVCVETYTDDYTTKIDSLKFNNISKICRIVNAPYDPNEKMVMGDSIKTTLDKTASYTVQFQNTGTDTAIRVVVTDTIDTRHLNLENFKLNWSDYPCDVIFEGKVIHFIFDNIKLPTLAKSGDKSIGAFNFSLGINPNTKIEKQVSNKVSIFFDFENPVITKPSIFEIKSPVEISKLKLNNYCVNQGNRVYLKSNLKTKTGNIYSLQLLDSNNNYITLNTKISNSIIDSMNFNLPKNLLAGTYNLRVLTSNPHSVSIPLNGEYEIVVLAKPVFNISSNLINNTACQGDTINIFADKTNLQYMFLNKNGSSFPNFSSILKYSSIVILKDTFKIISQNIEGCKDTQTIIPIVNIQPQSLLKVNNRKAKYCSGDSIQFNFIGGSSYVLYENNIPKYTTNNNALKISGINISTFKLKTINNFNCTNFSDTIQLNILPLPNQPIIKGNGNNLNIGQTNGLIKWYKNGQLIQNTDTIISNAASGTYYTIVTDANGCSSTSNIYLHNNLGIYRSDINSIKIYPNPTTNFITIENKLVENIHFELLDIKGKVILQRNIYSEFTEIDLQEIKTGIYLIRLTVSNSKVTILRLNIIK